MVLLLHVILVFRIPLKIKQPDVVQLLFFINAESGLRIHLKTIEAIKIKLPRYKYITIEGVIFWK